MHQNDLTLQNYHWSIQRQFELFVPIFIGRTGLRNHLKMLQNLTTRDFLRTFIFQDLSFNVLKLIVQDLLYGPKVFMIDLASLPKPSVAVIACSSFFKIY